MTIHISRRGVTLGASLSFMFGIPDAHSDTAGLRRYREKLAQARAGTRRLRIACIGDSLTTGAGAGNGGTTAVDGAKAFSYPSRLAGLFRDAGYRVSEDSVWGDSLLPDTGVEAVSRYDPKLSFAGSGWSRYLPVLGGLMFRAGKAAGELIFTPGDEYDVLDLYAIQQPGLASISVASGTVSTPVRTDGPADLVRHTIRVPKSKESVRITRDTEGLDDFIAALDCWSSETQVSIYNISAYGSTSELWFTAGSAWSPRNAVAAVSPDLILLNIGGADLATKVPPATYRRQMREIVRSWQKAGCDIVLIRHHPFRDSVDAGAAAEYGSVQYQLASEEGVPLIDLTRQFVNDASSRSLYADFIHLKASGYRIVASKVFELIGSGSR